MAKKKSDDSNGPLDNNKYTLKPPEGFNDKWKSKSKKSRFMWSFIGGKAISEKVGSIKEKSNFIGGMFSEMFKAAYSFMVFAKETFLILFKLKDKNQTQDVNHHKFTVKRLDVKSTQKNISSLWIVLFLFLIVLAYVVFSGKALGVIFNIGLGVMLLFSALAFIFHVIKQENEINDVNKLVMVRMHRNIMVYKVLLVVGWLFWLMVQVVLYRKTGGFNLVSAFSFAITGFTFYVYTYIKKARAVLEKMV